MRYYGFTYSDPLCGDVPWIIFQAATLVDAVVMHREFDRRMTPGEPSIIDRDDVELRIHRWNTVPDEVRQDEETQVVVRRGSGRLAWELADGSLLDVG